MEGLGILDFNSFTEFGDKTELSYFHSFPSSQDFAQLSSEWFIGSSGLKIKIYGGAGINFPTGSLAALRYAGATDIFGTQLSYPVIRSRRQNLNIYTSLDALESTIDTTSNGVTEQSSADEVRVLRLGEDYIAFRFVSGQYPAGDQSVLHPPVTRAGTARRLPWHRHGCPHGAAGRATQFHRD